jgi:hypothetical protein
MSGLPKRPRGVRKHWKREQAVDPSIFGDAFRNSYASPEWGEPVEVVQFSYRGIRKRIEGLYANGRTISIRLGKTSSRVVLSRLSL